VSKDAERCLGSKSVPALSSGFGLRISDFGFPSDFGFRISDFLPLFILAALLSSTASLCAAAQAGPPSADPYMALLMAQPKTEIASNVVAVAAFDPPVVRPGEAAVYRVSFDALEESILWPEKLNTPAELEFRPGGRGQIMQFNGTNFVPLTMFNYHVRAPRLGRFVVPQFTVTVYGKPVTVPAAQLEAAPSVPAWMMPAQGLVFEVSETNLYVGQPVKARILLGPSPSGQFRSLMQVQINGDGVLVDQGAARQRIGPVPRGAGTMVAYVYETVLTPLQTGKLTLFAQGYSAGNRPVGPVVSGAGPTLVRNNAPQFTLLDSEPVELQARPLPKQGELPGFTGAIGSFSIEPPRLAADPVRVGDAVKLSVTVHGDANVGRLAPPPPPQTRDWQVFAPAPEPLPPPSPMAVMTPQAAVPQTSTTFVYTLVPLTTTAHTTPAIPFSYFDPSRAVYLDLTIPEVSVTVQPGPGGADLRVLQQSDRGPGEAEKEPGLSGLAPAPGLAAATLAPVQRRLWFALVQLAVAAAFLGLWAWDRRRRFLEQHPEVVLRRQARRALRRQWRALGRAARAGDARRFADAAVAAMQAACAPYYPAEPRALVCADVLPLLGDLAAGPAGVARRFFALTDAARFGPSGADAKELLALQPELEKVLQYLERRL
jgi:hypothetical protein